MDDIETYAVDLVHIGAADCAQEDMDEDGCFADEADWRKARKLGADMAFAIRTKPASFLAWFRAEADR